MRYTVLFSYQCLTSVKCSCNRCLLLVLQDEEVADASPPLFLPVLHYLNNSCSRRRISIMLQLLRDGDHKSSLANLRQLAEKYSQTRLTGIIARYCRWNSPTGLAHSQREDVTVHTGSLTAHSQRMSQCVLAHSGCHTVHTGCQQCYTVDADNVCCGCQRCCMQNFVTRSVDAGMFINWWIIK